LGTGNAFSAQIYLTGKVFRLISALSSSVKTALGKSIAQLTPGHAIAFAVTCSNLQPERIELLRPFSI
jgi:hypothetical protein